ncbi:MAG: E3 binding domain-containing protein, partial [Sphingomonas sp.]|nr:E3 binding domain-containing protein [Sphingomonas sp.]
MPIEIKMPALSPTMEEGTLAKWLVKEGDTVKAGDLMAEIETDKATMEFEAVDEGVVEKIVVPEGADGVKVGEVIMLLSGEGEVAAPKPAAPKQEAAKPEAPKPETAPKQEAAPVAAPAPAPAAKAPARAEGDRVKASPLARRIAEQKGVDLGAIAGSGPNGRIVKADVEGAQPGAAPAARAAAAPAAAAA